MSKPLYKNEADRRLKDGMGTSKPGEFTQALIDANASPAMCEMAWSIFVNQGREYAIAMVRAWGNACE